MAVSADCRKMQYGPDAKARAYGVVAMFLALLFVAACGRGADVPALPPLAMDARILAFGDSLTYGTGASAEQSYPALLEARSGRRVINAGIPGETSQQGRERLEETLDDTNPDLVILCLGGNDMLRRQSRTAMADNLDAMVQMIRARGIPVVLVAVPELRGLALEPEPAYAELAARHGLPMQGDVLSRVLGRSSLKADLIHPNAAGYEIMADALYELLERAGAW